MIIKSNQDSSSMLVIFSLTIDMLQKKEAIDWLDKPNKLTLK